MNSNGTPTPYYDSTTTRLVQTNTSGDTTDSSEPTSRSTPSDESTTQPTFTDAASKTTEVTVDGSVFVTTMARSLFKRHVQFDTTGLLDRFTSHSTAAVWSLYSATARPYTPEKEETTISNTETLDDCTTDSPQLPKETTGSLLEVASVLFKREVQDSAELLDDSPAVEDRATNNHLVYDFDKDLVKVLDMTIDLHRDAVKDLHHCLYRETNNNFQVDPTLKGVNQTLHLQDALQFEQTRQCYNRPNEKYLLALKNIHLALVNHFGEEKARNLTKLVRKMSRMVEKHDKSQKAFINCPDSKYHKMEFFFQYLMIEFYITEELFPGSGVTYTNLEEKLNPKLFTDQGVGSELLITGCNTTTMDKGENSSF
ncbi:unnamed protein product [Bursaphelenchus okinawaensis]|uniref:Uncharacterized protein n=1 Tax=Bursaphelenchus okinawaensis TaxID=465554 RepID=A0A811JQT2_9BILA|nr:unnamed protein product [Bursaphelenchus okinawaensis]CAG9077826.1 unnamed protein product [Bursaphelenchus okinawaensis]